MDIDAIRRDFPLLGRSVGERPIIYFDNAATSLKPRPVIEAVTSYMTRFSANIHRGKHLLSEEASEAYEAARAKVARFINAAWQEVIFVRSATEGINLVASGLSLRPDDNVVGTVLEHHSNILPWRARCGYRAAPRLPGGLPDIGAAEALIDDATRAVVVTHCSNVTGVIVPVEEWARMAHRHGLPLLVDGAQAVPHRPIDVQQMDCDFLAFSGHKMLGPAGAGVLYGKLSALGELTPRHLGGGTVSAVNADFSYALRELPWRMEAGTPAIAAVLGLGAAVEYLQQLGMDAVQQHATRLERVLVAQLEQLPLKLCPGVDSGVPRTSMVSFVEPTGTLAPDYLSRVLSDTFGIMTRAGHHCAHPLHELLGLAGTLRVSLYLYNTEEEVERLKDALATLLKIVKRPSR